MLQNRRWEEGLENMEKKEAYWSLLQGDNIREMWLYLLKEALGRHSQSVYF